MSNTRIYDVLIAGSGPAGLSVALGLSRVRRTAAIFTRPNGAGFRNEGVTEMHNVLSRDKSHPLEFRSISTEQIKKYGTTDFFETDLVKIRTWKSPDQVLEGFEVEDSHGKTWIGRKLALAMGSIEVFPDIKGYRENWPHNIYQCMFCDGHERSHLPGGVLGFSSPMSAHLAQMVQLLQTDSSGPVTVFTDGVKDTTEGMGPSFDIIKALGCKIETDKIAQLVPATEPEIGVTVVLEGGREVKVGWLGHKPSTIIAGKDMVTELGVEIDDHPVFGQNIKVDSMGKTNVKGVFVAGDAGTPMKAVSNAIGTGAMVSAVITQELVAENVAFALQSYKEKVGSV